MLVRLFLTAVLAAGFASAQRGGSGGGPGGGGVEGAATGAGEMGGGVPQVRRLTPAELLFEKLKLNKEQKEDAVKILMAAAEKAAPSRALLTKGRVVIANAIIGKAGDEELKKILGEYTTVTATMTGIEAEAFAKLYALLKPNQQSKAPQAFEFLAGLFDTAPTAGGGRGRGEGRR